MCKLVCKLVLMMLTFKVANNGWKIMPHTQHMTSDKMSLHSKLQFILIVFISPWILIAFNYRKLAFKRQAPIFSFFLNLIIIDTNLFCSIVENANEMYPLTHTLQMTWYSQQYITLCYSSTGRSFKAICIIIFKIGSISLQ